MNKKTLIVLLCFLPLFEKVGNAQVVKKSIHEISEQENVSASFISPYKEFRDALHIFCFSAPENEAISRFVLKSKQEARTFFYNVVNSFRFDYFTYNSGCYGSDISSDIVAFLGGLSPYPSWGTVILFFSGHGVNSNDHYYFITRDSRKDDLPDTSVDGDFIKQTVTRLADKGFHVILFLDTCNAGAILDGFHPHIKDGGSIAIYASSLASEDSNEFDAIGGSPYSIALARAFNGSYSSAVDINGNITYQSLGNYLFQSLRNEPRQTPVYKLYNLKETDVILSNISSIEDYLRICEKYNADIDAVKKALSDKNYRKALDMANAADSKAIAIDSLDKKKQYSLSSVKDSIITVLGKQKNPESVSKLIKDLVVGEDLDSAPVFQALGTATLTWVRGLPRTANARNAYNSGLMFLVLARDNGADEEQIARLVSGYLESMNQNYLFDLDEDLVPAFARFILEFKDALAIDSFSQASLISCILQKDTSLNSDEREELNTQIVSLWKSSSTQTAKFNLLAAHSYFSLGDMLTVRSILSSYVLKVPSDYQKTTFKYSEFQKDTRREEFMLFTDTLDPSNRKELQTKFNK